MIAALLLSAALALPPPPYVISFGGTLPREDNIAADCSQPEVRAVVHSDSIFAAWLVLGTAHRDTIGAARGTYLKWRFLVWEFKPYIALVTPLRLTQAGWVPACRPSGVVCIPKPWVALIPSNR